MGDQLHYIRDRHAPRAADALLTRVERFIEHTLAAYPRTGRYVAQREIWETWIPGTRLVAWYVFTDEDLTIITFWHTAQDRHG